MTMGECNKYFILMLYRRRQLIVNYEKKGEVIDWVQIDKDQEDEWDELYYLISLAVA